MKTRARRPQSKWAFALLFETAFGLSPLVAGEVEIYPVPETETVSSTFLVKVNGQTVPVIYQSTSPRMSYAHFSFSGTVEIEVSGLSGHTISPEALGITPDFDDGSTMRFTLTEPRYLLLQNNYDLNSLLAIWADPIDENPVNPDAAGVLAVTPQSMPLQQAVNKVALDPELHTVYVGPGYYPIDGLQIFSNMTVYLAGGALLGSGGVINGSRTNVSGSVAVIDNENVRILGRSKIRGVVGNYPALYCLRAKNVVVDGLILTFGGWNVQIRDCDGVDVRRIKIASGRTDETGRQQKNADGLNISNTQNARTDFCYIACHDDGHNLTAFSLAYEGTQKPVKNIYTSNTVIHNTAAQSASTGQNTRMDSLVRVVYENTYALGANGEFGLYASKGCTIRDVLFRNFYNEGGGSGFVSVLSIHDSPDPKAGNIRDLAFKNIYNSRNLTNPFHVSGISPDYSVDGVTLVNIHNAGNLVTDISTLSIKEFASNVTLGTHPVAADAIDYPWPSAEMMEPGTITVCARAHHLNAQPITVEFYANGTQIGSDNSAPFSASWSPSPGSYLLNIHVRDGQNNVDSLRLGHRVTIIGQPRLDSIAVIPADFNLGVGAQTQYSAIAFDQNGHPLVPQPEFNWSISGGGSFDDRNVLTAGNSAGSSHTIQVCATAGGVSAEATATVTISDVLTVSNLHVFSGEPYRWETVENEQQKHIDGDRNLRNPPQQYTGLPYLVTAGKDKFFKGPTCFFEVNYPIRLYVAVSENFDTSVPWFSGFTGTGDKLDNNQIYAKEYQAGRIALGQTSTEAGMYQVFFEPLDGNIVVAAAPGAVAAQALLKAPVLSVAHNSVCVRNAPVGSTVSVYSISGRLVTTHILKNSHARIPLSSSRFGTG